MYGSKNDGKTCVTRLFFVKYVNLPPISIVLLLTTGKTMEIQALGRAPGHSAFDDPTQYIFNLFLHNSYSPRLLANHRPPKLSRGPPSSHYQWHLTSVIVRYIMHTVTLILFAVFLFFLIYFPQYSSHKYSIYFAITPSIQIISRFDFSICTIFTIYISCLGALCIVKLIYVEKSK